MMVADSKLAVYAPQAANLFNNMKTPASILAGAMVPLVIMGPLTIRTQHGDGNHHPWDIRLRKLYNFVGLFSLLSELLSVVWATVAVNQLTETTVPVATESVWHLLQGPYRLPWCAVNAHFVMGMLGFAICTGMKVYYHVGKGRLGQGLAATALSGLLLMTSVINRGVASGGGDGARYGRSVLALFSNYTWLLWKQALGLLDSEGIGVLELGSIIAGLLGMFQCLASIVGDQDDDDKKKQ